MAENTSNLYLIVGLGNPGRQYERTRHNVGWEVLDLLAKRHGLQFRTKQARAEIARGTIAGRPVILAKPQTFMNLSGQAVRALVQFYKLPLAQVLIIHDDLDLPLGTIRLRERGSAGGHNGLTSVIQQLGTPNVPRLRVGIERPPVPGDQVNWVLGHFSAAERAELAPALSAAADAAETWLREGITPAMNRFNGGQGSGARDPGSGIRDPGLEARGIDPSAPVASPKAKIQNPKSLSGLGAQIAGLQARLGRRPLDEHHGDREDTE
jgi:PTH1 family peptidyl-tRNA hydrolase